METASIAPVSPLAAGSTAGLSRLPDETLAALTGRGSEAAFAALYERYHQALYRYCRSILHHEADAQDALQSAFASGLAALQTGQRTAPVRPWLFRIAHNEAISVVRRRRLTADDLSDALPHLAPSAEEREAERARFAQLVADLSELPERARAALLMRELSGLSHQEIAIALGTSKGAAKQAVFDARRALHELEEGRAMGCEEVRRRISDGDGRALRSRRVRAHLRDCTSCSDFAAAIPRRTANLRALAPPLPAAASAALLSHALNGISMHGAGANAAATSAAATSAAATSAAATGTLGGAVGTAMASKAAVGATVAALAAAGAGGVTAVLATVAKAPRTTHRQALHGVRNGVGVRGALPQAAYLSRDPTSHGAPNRDAESARSVPSVPHPATPRGLPAALHPGRWTSAGTVGPLPSSTNGTGGSGNGSPARGASGAGGSPQQDVTAARPGNGLGVPGGRKLQVEQAGPGSSRGQSSSAPGQSNSAAPGNPAVPSNPAENGNTAAHGNSAGHSNSTTK